MTEGSDCRDRLDDSFTEKLQALAFQELCQHLRDRSDNVTNIDMMALTGFCRNCLAKWMVLGARKIVDDPREGDGSLPVKALNDFGYDEAAEHVYGMHYPEWKKQHQKKSTPEQMERFEASQPIQAKHDKARLEKRSTVAATTTLASNVCCEEPPTTTAPATTIAKHTRTLPPYVPPPLPPTTSTMRFAVLTVSDRAFQNAYATGDLSGPAVVASITHMIAKENAPANPPPPIVVETAIVPDDRDAILQQLRIWTDNNNNNAVDCVLTTGGTGFAPRDVTPEAVREILTVELAHVMPWVTGECARRQQPLSSLSRGVAGVCAKGTVVATLPGSPKGVAEMMPFLLPLLLHAVEELRTESQE